LKWRGHSVSALVPRSINRTSKVSPGGAFGPLARLMLRLGRCFARLSHRSTPQKRRCLPTVPTLIAWVSFVTSIQQLDRKFKKSNELTVA
jgi:hypothetical protein